jgi:hypothetical protein
VRSELGFSIEQWDALHFDERVVYLEGLAQVVALKYPGALGAGAGVVEADSSPASTVDSEDTPVGRLSRFGIQTRTEEVTAE